MPAIPRIHVDTALAEGLALPLPANATRHVQVLRLQPGDALTLFDGHGGEWAAEVLQMGRREVTARVLDHRAVDCELPCVVTLALGMPANERMDTLVEKATELGVAAIQPLVCERSVLRVAGDRAERKAAHWQAVAVAACEQSGRNRVPLIGAPLPLREWLDSLSSDDRNERLMLSLEADAPPALKHLQSMGRALWCEAPDAGEHAGGRTGAGVGSGPVVAAADRARSGLAFTVFSGPEGGLSPAEQALARQHRFAPVSLGPRVLRADTAPLAMLAVLGALPTD